MCVKLYPNPGSHTVYIELEDEDNIENENGSTTRETNALIKEAIGRERSDFPSGLYLFRIVTDKGVRYAKFVKR